MRRSVSFVVRVAGASMPELVTSPLPLSEPIVSFMPLMSMTPVELTVNALADEKVPALA